MTSTFKIVLRNKREAEIPLDYARAKIAKWLGIDPTKTYIDIGVNHNGLVVKWAEDDRIELPPALDK